MNRWGAGTGAEWPGDCRPQRYNAGNPSRRWRARGRSAANCSNQRGCPQTVFTGAGLPGQVGPNAHVRPADGDAAAERQTSGEEHALQVLLSTGRAQAQGPATPLSVVSASSETSVSKPVLTRSICNPRLPPRVPPPRPSTPPLPSHGPSAPQSRYYHGGTYDLEDPVCVGRGGANEPGSSNREGDSRSGADDRVHERATGGGLRLELPIHREAFPL